MNPRGADRVTKVCRRDKEPLSEICSETMLGRVLSSVLMFVWHIALEGTGTRVSIGAALVMITIGMIIRSHDHTIWGWLVTAIAIVKGSLVSPEKGPNRDRPRDKVSRIRGQNHGTDSNKGRPRLTLGRCRDIPSTPQHSVLYDRL